MIGSLLYLTAFKLDILFSVGLCTRFQQDPREVHVIIVKRIFIYLIETFNLGLYFNYNKEFRLISYCDVDNACEKIERRSTSGSYHIISGKLVTWIINKQGSIALSTIEEKYISAASCCTQLIWIKNQLEDYNIYEENISIYCDDKATISISKNLTLHSRAKHIEIKHYFLRDHVLKGTMEL